MKIGFIGCGNMATAMIRGILDSKKVTAGEMIASAKSDATREKISRELGICVAGTNSEVVDFADVIFLAATVLRRSNCRDQRRDPAGSDYSDDCTGQDPSLVGRAAGRGQKDHPHHAEYTCHGQRRHDGNV